MEVFLIFLILAILVFLFILHVLTREDYALMRRNISMEQLFNITLVTLLGGIVVSRIGYIAFHFQPVYLNPVVFLALPYFPGLSLSGALLGIFVTLGYICLKKKYPWKKFFDFFSIAFSCSLPVAVIGTLFLHPGQFLWPILISVLFYGLIGLISLGLLYRKILTSTIPDGITTLLFLLSLSAVYLIEMILIRKSASLFSHEIILFMLLLIGMIGSLLFLFITKKVRKVRT